MSYSRMIFAVALLAMGSWLASPAMAGEGKNGGGGGPSKNGGGCSGNCGGGGGGGGGGFTERIICVVNGRRFEVTDVRKCYPQRKIVYRYVRYHFEHDVKRIYRAKRPPVCGCMSKQYGDNGSYGGSYTGGGYYAGSVAARMQAERRDVAMSDGGVYYNEDEASGYNDAPVRNFKKVRRYVIHYGPTIAKDGGY